MGIKWPNDLVATDGRKLAGVLAEADLASTPRPRVALAPVVVGIGINVNWPAADDDLPAELRGLAVSLRQLVGAPVDREALLGALLAALGPRVRRPRSAVGPGAAGRRPPRRLYDGREPGAGRPGRRVLRGDGHRGSTEGHLVVDVRRGPPRTVVAGDVVHLRPGS